jgi:hypothetical protein
MKEIHATVKDTDAKIVYLEHEQSMSSMMMTALMAFNVVVLYLTWGVPYAVWFMLTIACWQVYAYFLGKMIGEMKTRCSFQRGVIEMMTTHMEQTLADHAPTPDGTNDDETCLSETGHEKD